jgi:hypothetical protein
VEVSDAGEGAAAHPDYASIILVGRIRGHRSRIYKIEGPVAGGNIQVHKAKKAKKEKGEKGDDDDDDDDDDDVNGNGNGAGDL